MEWTINAYDNINLRIFTLHYLFTLVFYDTFIFSDRKTERLQP